MSFSRRSDGAIIIDFDTGEGMDHIPADIFENFPKYEFEACLDIFRTLLQWQAELENGKEKSNG